MIKHIKSPQDLKDAFDAAGSKLVVIDFHAQWCGPCKMIAPKLEELANQYDSEIVVVKIDVDECEEIAVEYGVSSMPTFIFMKDRKKLDEFSGANYERLKTVIENLK